MPTSTRWTTGWTSSRGLAVQTEDTEQDFGCTQGKNYSDPRVEEPIRNA